MPRFIVRTNCEYSIAIDAENEEAAVAKADEIPHDEWEQAWAASEAEEE